MTLNPIEIMNKTKLEVTGFDEIVMLGWTVLIVIIAAAVWTIIEALWKK